MFGYRWENSGTELDARDFRPCWSETETVRLWVNFCLALSFDLRPSVSLPFSLPLPVLVVESFRLFFPFFSSLLLNESSLTILYYTIHVAYALLPSWSNYSASHCVRTNVHTRKPHDGGQRKWGTTLAHMRWHNTRHDVHTRIHKYTHAAYACLRRGIRFPGPLFQAPLLGKNVDVIMKPSIACKRWSVDLMLPR